MMPLLLGLLVAAILVWWEWRQAGTGRRRIARSAASVGAVAGLVWIGLRPERHAAERLTDALVITPGALADRVEHLIDSLRPGRVFTLGSAPSATRFPGAVPLPDLGTLGRRYPDLKSVHLTGWGAPAAELAGLEGPALHFDPAPLPVGFGPVAWPARLARGDLLTVRGAVRPPGKGEWVYLEDPGGLVDSARIEGLEQGRGRFTISARPRAAGRWRYVLRAGRAPGPGVAETLGVEVEVPAPLRVLVLEGAPTFETRFLKEWLARGGAELVVRSTVSRDRVRAEFINRKSAGPGTVRDAIQDDPDLVIADGRTLAALAGADRSLLLAAVRDRRTGLLVVPDAAKGGDVFLGQARSLGFHPVALGDPEERGIRPRWPDRPVASQIAVPALAAELRPRFAVLDLVRDESGRIVAQVAVSGAGRIAVTLVAEPSRWLLAGDRRSFAEYWASLLGAVARTPALSDSWQVESGPPYRVDQRLALDLLSQHRSAAGTVVTPARADTIPLVADPADSHCASGLLWPREAGWHRVGDSLAGARWFYVQAGDAWQGVDAAARVQATRLAAVLGARGIPEPAGAAPGVSRPLPLWPALLLFLACAGYLWWRPRPRFLVEAGAVGSAGVGG